MSIDELTDNLQQLHFGPSLSPLIKWSGGKSDEISKFYKYIPKFDLYIEPFIGGGSLYFHLSPKKAIINDIHSELIDFYQTIKDKKSNLIYDFMKDKQFTETEYYNIRDNMDIVDYIDNAKRFYYLRKTCYRGMLRYNKNGKFNIPYGRYKSCNFEILQNKNYEKLFENTHIYNVSFEKIFQTYDNPNNFVFIDQPYDSDFTDYGYCKFNKDEQIKLADCFKSTQNKCLMIIGKTDFISSLYHGYIKDEYDKKYKFKIHSNRVGNEINTKHLIITNY